jgi:5-methylcytosine-specific restriction enzyme subunit McrC
LDCEYTDFVADTSANRLLRGVLELLAPAAQNQAIRRQLDEALSYFGEVASVHPSLREFDRVRVTRLNEHYGPSLALARLALEGAGVTDAAGSAIAPAHFVLMWKVWENSVASALRDAGLRRLLEKPLYTTAFQQLAGTPQSSVGIEPDLVIGRRTAPNLIVDLKWAPVFVTDRHGRKRLRNEHLYQIGAYCTALHSDGMLLYPLMDDFVDSTYGFEGCKIHIRTVDLDQPHLNDLRSTAAEIADLASE